MTSYYRSSAPGTWGTSNYRFGHPREPLFRPQSTCEFHPILISRRRSCILTPYTTLGGGLDYYQAHAVDPDP